MPTPVLVQLCSQLGYGTDVAHCTNVCAAADNRKKQPLLLLFPLFDGKLSENLMIKTLTKNTVTKIDKKVPVNHLHVHGGRRKT